MNDVWFVQFRTPPDPPACRVPSALGVEGEGCAVPLGTSCRGASEGATSPDHRGPTAIRGNGLPITAGPRSPSTTATLTTHAIRATWRARTTVATRDLLTNLAAEPRRSISGGFTSTRRGLRARIGVCGRGRGWPCGRVTQHTTYASAYAVPSVSIEQDPRTDPHTEPVRSVGPYTREEGGASGSDAPAGRCLAMSPGFEASLPPLVPCRILGAVHGSGRHGRGSRVRWAGRHEFHLRGYCGVDVTCLGCLAR